MFALCLPALTFVSSSIPVGTNAPNVRSIALSP